MMISTFLGTTAFGPLITLVAILEYAHCSVRIIIWNVESGGTLAGAHTSVNKSGDRQCIASSTHLATLAHTPGSHPGRVWQGSQ